MKPSTPKGTRDFSPAEMARRNYIFDTVKAVFRTHGFSQIETPAMETTETLMGKYGEEGDRLIFKILESGDFLSKIYSSADVSLDPFTFRKFIAEVSEGLEYDLWDALVEGFENTGGYQGADPFPWKTNITINDKKLNDCFKRLSRGYNLFLYGLLFSMFDTFQPRKNEGFVNYRPIKRYLDIFRNLDSGLKIRQMEFQKAFSEDFEFYLKSPYVYGVLNDVGVLSDYKAITPFLSEKALRYDLTVPFARYVVQHRNELTFPFKRFQIQPVWRADRPQKGRYREFYQCDVDVIGSDSLLNEVELVQIIDSVFGKLNIPVTLKLNNRKLLAAIAQVVGAPDAFVDITVALDKLDKIGEEKVVEELKQRNISDASIEKLLPLIRFQGDTQQKLAFLSKFLGDNELGLKGIEEVQTVIGNSQPLISANTIVELDLTLARGLNYYTGAIFEVKSNLPNTLTSTICGGGRYDDLTGIFGLPNVSGVGISFGADRIYDVLLEAGLFPDSAQEGTQVLFTNFGESESLYCLPMVKAIREAGISVELFPESGKMKKQLGYADNLGIPFVAMVGESEMNANVIALKNMKTSEQVSVTLAQLINLLKGK